MPAGSQVKAMYRNKDYEAFKQNKLGNFYEKIGSYNIFMQCDSPNTSAFCELPDGYSFRLCRRDELEVWKHIVVEEQYIDYVTEYYDKVYAKHEDEFFNRCMFVCDAEGNPVASTFIWHSYGQINTIGWFRVMPKHEGKKLGRALISRILRNAEFPIYLHTQPSSVRAII